MARMTIAGMLLGAAALLTACGQKGPLYLPDEKPAAVPAQPAPAANAPATATAPPEEEEAADRPRRTP